MTTSSSLLAGIAQHTVKTDRLEIAYLEAGKGSTPLSTLVFSDNWARSPVGLERMFIQRSRWSRRFAPSSTIIELTAANIAKWSFLTADTRRMSKNRKCCSGSSLNLWKVINSALRLRQAFGSFLKLYGEVQIILC